MRHVVVVVVIFIRIYGMLLVYPWYTFLSSFSSPHLSPR